MVESNNSKNNSPPDLILHKQEPCEDKVYRKKAKPQTVHDKLRSCLKELYQALEWTDTLLNDLPKKWKICDDLIILPPTCFTLSDWTTGIVSGEALWSTVANVFKVKRVAKEHRVKSDDFRTPNMTLLYGTDPIVLINNNGIK